MNIKFHQLWWIFVEFTKDEKDPQPAVDDNRKAKCVAAMF